MEIDLERTARALRAETLARSRGFSGATDQQLARAAALDVIEQLLECEVYGHSRYDILVEARRDLESKP